MEKLNVLIPTDFSVQAEFAYLMVKKLAEKTDIQIEFLHVLNVPDTVTIDPNGLIQTCGEIDVNYVKTQKEIAERKLQNLRTLYGDHISVKLVAGKTTQAVIEHAQNNRFDLIVMGTKGAWGWKEKLSGSETQMVARKSTVPVLSLMCDRSDLVIENILFVHDFKDIQNQDLTLLHKLIRAFNTRVHFLHICKNHSEEEKNKISEGMKKFAEINNIHSYDSHILMDKDVENGVIHFNQMNEMDIVCIGTHGKGGIFHSSATEKLINHMFKPIISYHIN
ncbi:MAG: universal stress protein [Flavobacteriales bacterium]|nr:universal stress protein [Flavobacteriales bacterium]